MTGPLVFPRLRIGGRIGNPLVAIAGKTRGLALTIAASPELHRLCGEFDLLLFLFHDTAVRLTAAPWRVKDWALLWCPVRRNVASFEAVDNGHPRRSGQARMIQLS